MRAREILDEDYNQSLASDLNNILIGAKASGIVDIKPDVIVRQMQKMGYSIDTGSLMTLLQDNPTVLNASPENIHMAGPDEAGVGGSVADTQSTVSSLAQTATSKGLK